MAGESSVAILGSTGSIGCNALAVISDLPGFRVSGLTGHTNVNLLFKQAQDHLPRRVILSDANSTKARNFPRLEGVEFFAGMDEVLKLAADKENDIVVAAIVGRAGLESAWVATEAGKRLALANKETLVVAGSQITKLAREKGTEIIPIDSEHSAIFQCMHSGKSSEVSRVVLTASGGPFREFGSQQLKCVTVEQALAHPTWEMGRKITVDSATMMNKALEIVEARWLFDITPDQISVVIHPQSVIHSMVEFCDGSIVSQMSPPDMKLPIQYALTYPDRLEGRSPRLNLEAQISLDLIPPDFDRFPALGLGFEVAEKGGTTGAVLNAANEAAVEAFLNKQISFTDIVASCREILDNHTYEPSPTLDSLLKLDLWAREEINKWITC